MSAEKLDQEAATLKREILEAFADVPFPDADSVACCADLAEEERCKELLGGKRIEEWKDKPLEALAGGIHMPQLPFISDWAYQYYLPLYMLTAVFHWDEADVIPENLISSFTWEGKLQDFTARQLSAILSFLSFIKQRHFRATHSESWQQDVDQAIKSIQSLLDARKSGAGGN